MRIDNFLVEIGKYPSRTKASEFIKAGKVLYKGKPVKPSFMVDSLEDITFVEGLTFVSNGGYKLEKALTEFNYNVSDKTFIDIGASNGGFTDCLFKRGAKKVYCVDVGESQLDKSLLDKNVVILDNFNARNLSIKDISCEVDGITCDVSFISLTYIICVLNPLLKKGGVGFLLIKPQFECGKTHLNKNGIITSNDVKIKVCEKIYNECLKYGLIPINLTNAPIKENKNVEFILQIIKDEKIIPFDKNLIKETIRGAKC